MRRKLLWDSEKQQFIECVELVDITSTIVNVSQPFVTIMIPKGTLVRCDCTKCEGESYHAPRDLHIEMGITVNVETVITAGTVGGKLKKKRPQTDVQCVVEETLW